MEPLQTLKFDPWKFAYSSEQTLNLQAYVAPKHSGSLNNVDGDFKMYRNGNLKLYNYGMKKLQGRWRDA